MANLILLRAKDPKGGWLQNFHLGAWKMRNEDNTAWVPMNTKNTRIANPDFDAGDAESEKWLIPGDPRQTGA